MRNDIFKGFRESKMGRGCRKIKACVRSPTPQRGAVYADHDRKSAIPPIADRQTERQTDRQTDRKFTSCQSDSRFALRSTRTKAPAASDSTDNSPALEMPHSCSQQQSPRRPRPNDNVSYINTPQTQQRRRRQQNRTKRTGGRLEQDQCRLCSAH